MYEYLHPHKLYRSATHADSAQQKQRISAASLEVSGRKAELVQRLRDSPMVLMPTNSSRIPRAGCAKKQQLIISLARRSVLLLMLYCCTCAYGEAPGAEIDLNSFEFRFALMGGAENVHGQAAAAIHKLVALIRDGTDEQKQHAAKALVSLVPTENFTYHDMIEEDKAAKAANRPVARALNPKEVEIARRFFGRPGVWTSRRGKMAFEIAKAGGIPPLVALIRDGSDAQKRIAASALENLAANADNREAIIRPLVALVRDGTDAQKASAAGALQNLAQDDDSREAIIKPLVALVRDGDDEQKEVAAGALENLADCADNKIPIAQAGGIPPLVALVRDGNDAQKRIAASALQNLAANADNHILIAQAHDNMFAEKAGISSLLAEHGLSSEVAAAVSWFRTMGADTLRDVIEAGLQEDFVESLGYGEDSLLLRLPVSVRSYFGGLPPIKRGKLLRALQRMGAQERMPKDDL